MSTILKGISAEIVPENKIKRVKKISYSQWSSFAKCPLSWKLKYIDRHQTFTDNINNLFGTAMHETIQDYLIVLYETSAQKANAMDLDELLYQKLTSEFLKSKRKTGVAPTTQLEMESYYKEGCVLLAYFLKKRTKYFPVKNHRLVGIEVVIDKEASDINKNVNFIGYLDIVIEDTLNHRLKIIDLKTSKRGWNKWAKMDKIKTGQLVVYKKYYAEQFNYDIDRVDIQYLILRRQIDEAAMYPAPRIQHFTPASGKPTINVLMRQVNVFIKAGFTDDGEYNINGNFLPVAGVRSKNCRWCSFRDDESLCPKKERIKE